MRLALNESTQKNCNKKAKMVFGECSGAHMSDTTTGSRENIPLNGGFAAILLPYTLWTQQWQPLAGGHVQKVRYKLVQALGWGGKG